MTCRIRTICVVSLTPLMNVVKFSQIWTQHLLSADSGSVMMILQYQSFKLLFLL